MRRLAAFLLLAAGTGLVFDSSLTRAGDNDSEPPGDRVEDPNSGEAPAPGRGKRGERGRRGRGGPPENGGRPGGGPGGPRHQGPPPVIAALDAVVNGVISSSEIAGAVAALKTLDRNGDGELTMDELAPERPGRGGPAGGEFGRRGGREGTRGPGDRGRERRGGRPSPEEFVARVMESDEDGDGRISRDEAPDRLLRGFDRIDADGSGMIDKSELEEAAKRFGEGRGREGGPGGRNKARRPAPDDDTSV